MRTRPSRKPIMSDDEKKSQEVSSDPEITTHNQLVDPDAGKDPREKAEIVGSM